MTIQITSFQRDPFQLEFKKVMPPRIYYVLLLCVSLPINVYLFNIGLNILFSVDNLPRYFDIMTYFLDIIIGLLVILGSILFQLFVFFYAYLGITHISVDYFEKNVFTSMDYTLDNEGITYWNSLTKNFISKHNWSDDYHVKKFPDIPLTSKSYGHRTLSIKRKKDNLEVMKIEFNRRDLLKSAYNFDELIIELDSFLQGFSVKSNNISK